MSTPHPICAQLRSLRKAAGLSLDAFTDKYGIVPGVVLASYERGDRQPTVQRLDDVLACYGFHLVAVPIGAEVDDRHVRTRAEAAAELRAIADQLDPPIDPDIADEVAAKRREDV